MFNKKPSSVCYTHHTLGSEATKSCTRVRVSMLDEHIIPVLFGVCVCACTFEGQRSTLGYFISCFQHFSLRQSLSSNLALTIAAGLTWSNPSTGVTSTHSHTWVFGGGGGSGVCVYVYMCVYVCLCVCIYFVYGFFV